MNTYESLPEVDQLAVQRDAEHLDALARRDTGGPSEGVHALLWALGADVDEGLAALLAAPMVDSRPEPAVVLSLVDASRRRGARTLTAALLATGLVSLSGVAAAVTGDPLSPYRSVISAVTDDQDRSGARDDERVERQLSDVRSAIGDGDLARAQAGVETLRADLTTLTTLTEGKQHSLMRRLAVLEAQLERAEAKQATEAAKAAEKAARKASDPARPGGQVNGTKPDKAVPPGQTGSKTEPNGNNRGSRSTPTATSKKATKTNDARSSAEVDTSDRKAPKG